MKILLLYLFIVVLSVKSSQDCCVPEKCYDSNIITQTKLKGPSCGSGKQWTPNCAATAIFRGSEYGLTCNPSCGNGLCEHNEDQANCPEDCGEVGPQCTVGDVQKNDPLFSSQWQLQDASVGGVNAPAAWSEGFTGEGSQVCVIDDGLQWRHPEFQCKYVAASSDNVNDDGTTDPDPFAVAYGNFNGVFSSHGTVCSGMATASDNNACGIGVAPRSKIAGIRAVAKPVQNSKLAASLTKDGNNNHIYSCSWGPSDNGATLFVVSTTVSNAIVSGSVNGRNGKGSIYVWAAGNGKGNGDYAGFDGYNNLIQTISVGAVGCTGKVAYYSESGSCLLVVGPGGDASDGKGVVSSDLMSWSGYVGSSCVAYGNRIQGTSFSAPAIAGMAALILSANNKLTWRDVQYVMIAGAVQNDPEDSDWSLNGAGLHVNHKYGFGLVDAGVAVETANNWNNVGKQEICQSGVISVNKVISGVISRDFKLTSGACSNIRSLEHVIVKLTATHAKRGDLEFRIKSPNGTESILAIHRTKDTATTFTSYPFLSVRFWGESAVGTWTVTLADVVAGNTGTWNSFEIIFYGAENSSYIHHNFSPPPDDDDDDSSDAIVGGIVLIFAAVVIVLVILVYIHKRRRNRVAETGEPPNMHVAAYGVSNVQYPAPMEPVRVVYVDANSGRGGPGN